MLGAPDLILLTLSEFADQAHRICRAGNLPLLVDADHGYGNPLNVMRTVEELETAGISALSIEDTRLPQPHARDEASALVSIEEGRAKMRAAIEARRDPNLVIAGRTSAVFKTSVEDAIARAQAYEAEGVDALFFVGVKTRAQLDALADALTLPMILGGVGPEIMDLDYLSSKNVRVCLQGHQPIMAAVEAVHSTLKALREGTAPADLERIASSELMGRVTRRDDHDRWREDFLT